MTDRLSRVIRLMSLLGITIVPGCCAPISPTVPEVKTWVARELPVGSSETDVLHFCEAHQFMYKHDDPIYAEAARRIGGCESERPLAIISIQYDDGGRLKSANVRGAAMVP